MCRWRNDGCRPDSMTKPRVIVTRRWPQSVERILTQEFDALLNRSDAPLAASDLQAALRDADALLPTVSDKMDAGVFAIAKPRARLLANYGVGCSHIDLDAARRLGIAVTNTPGVLSECTADLTMTLILMVARRAGEGERKLRAGTWYGWGPSDMLGSRVSGKTLGIVGFGRIGRAVAERAHFGFGMRILAYNPRSLDEQALARCQGERMDSLDALLGQADFVSLHCPGGDANRNLINRARLEAMKPDAFLINTARGEIVDEAALAQALAEGVIKGAGLDVFVREPQVTEALLACENAVLLPHMGSASVETREAMGLRVVKNLRAFFAGEALPDRVA